MDKAEREALMRALGEVIVEEVKRATESIRQEVSRLSLELKQAEIKVREMRYAGVWTDRATYRQGNFVSHAGSMWHCNLDDVATMPGSDPHAWTLCVKRGADTSRPSA